MRLKDGTILTNMDDKVVVVDASNRKDRFNGMLRLNNTAGFVAKQLEKETELDDVVKAMTEKFDVEESVARENAQKVIDSLRDAGLLQ